MLYYFPFLPLPFFSLGSLRQSAPRYGFPVLQAAEILPWLPLMASAASVMDGQRISEPVSMSLQTTGTPALGFLICLGLPRISARYLAFRARSA